MFHGNFPWSFSLLKISMHFRLYFEPSFCNHTDLGIIGLLERSYPPADLDNK